MNLKRHSDKGIAWQLFKRLLLLAPNYSKKFHLFCLAIGMFVANMIFGAFLLDDLCLAQESETPSIAGSYSEEAPLTVEVVEPRVAIEGAGMSYSTTTYASPVSELRYDPLVDLQTRNLAEGQGDLSIRGGIFENSGIIIGGANIFDPQTGHYLTELPVPVQMLSAPAVLTGTENATYGFNAVAGSVAYDWQAIEKNSAFVLAGVGDFRSSMQEAYASAANLLQSDLGRLNLDLDFAHSESQGTLPHGDHIFTRYSGRLQLSDGNTQTDFFGGFQQKYFSWPDLYATSQLHELTNTSGIESEELGTALFILNQRRRYGPGGASYVEYGSFFRRNRDDYEFDRYQPALYNPYVHKTQLWSAGLNGRHLEGDYRLDYSGNFAGDNIDSTALTFGDFNSRNYWHGSLLGGRYFDVSDSDKLLMQAGASLLDTNRDSAHVSPIAAVSLESENSSTSKNTYYAQISQAAQVVGYQALSSNPAGGLFRGNSDLGKTISTNYESGVSLQRQSYSGKLAFFYRKDNDLVDWTYSQADRAYTARSANNVDVATTGVETLLEKSFDTLKLISAYTYIHKNSEYNVTDVDASFYALNYPRHRFSLGLVYQPIEEIELRMDNKIQRQQPNMLRSNGTRAFFSSLALVWNLDQIKGLSLSAQIDNLWDEDFEEIPGVPGSKRAAGVAAKYSW